MKDEKDAHISPFLHYFHNLSETATWTQVAAGGRIPRARYRASLVTHEHSCILFGGHDGSKHLKMCMCLILVII
jgi:hypothetical protein